MSYKQDFCYFCGKQIIIRWSVFLIINRITENKDARSNKNKYNSYKDDTLKTVIRQGR